MHCRTLPRSVYIPRTRLSSAVWTMFVPFYTAYLKLEWYPDREMKIIDLKIQENAAWCFTSCPRPVQCSSIFRAFVCLCLLIGYCQQDDDSQKWAWKLLWVSLRHLYRFSVWRAFWSMLRCWHGRGIQTFRRHLNGGAANVAIEGINFEKFIYASLEFSYHLPMFHVQISRRSILLCSSDKRSESTQIPSDEATSQFNFVCLIYRFHQNLKYMCAVSGSL